MPLRQLVDGVSDELFARLKVILDLGGGPETIAAGVRTNRWVLEGIRSHTKSGEIAALADHVLGLIGPPQESPDAILAALQKLVSTYRIKTETLDEGITFASIQALLTIVTATVALFVGSGGIFGLAAKSPPAAVRLIAPADATQQNSVPIFVVNTALKRTLHAMQAVVIFVLLVVLVYGFRPGIPRLRVRDGQPGEPPGPDENQQVISGTIRQFYPAWYWIWGSWFIYYVALTVRESLFPESTFATISLGWLSYLNTLGFYWCFFVLDMPSVRTTTQAARNRPFLRAIGTTAAVGALLWCLQTYCSLHESVAARSPHAIEVLCTLYETVAIAFFVGRLDSHDFAVQIPRIFLYVLYAYAGLQVLQPFLALFSEFQFASIYIAALGLKVLLFMVVYSYLNEAALREYVKRVKESLDRNRIAAEDAAGANI